MKLLRTWRQYDSVKGAVMLLALAAFLVGYCIRAAANYAQMLRKPPEYVCAVPIGYDALLLRLAQDDAVRGYSPQKTADLTQNTHVLTVTYLSAAYLADCYGLAADARVIWANDTAFAAVSDDPQAQSLRLDGTVDGSPFSAEIIRTDALPQGQPLAVMAVSAAVLHDAPALRICLAAPDPAALAQLGLQILNPETALAADYEKQLVLLRIRFAALSALLSCIGAGAFLRIYRLRRLEDAPWTGGGTDHPV